MICARFSTAASGPRTSHSVRRFLSIEHLLERIFNATEQMSPPLPARLLEEFPLAAPNHGTDGGNRFPSRACALRKNIADAVRRLTHLADSALSRTYLGSECQDSLPSPTCILHVVLPRVAA